MLVFASFPRCIPYSFLKLPTLRKKYIVKQVSSEMPLFVVELKGQIEMIGYNSDMYLSTQNASCDWHDSIGVHLGAPALLHP